LKSFFQVLNLHHHITHGSSSSSGTSHGQASAGTASSHSNHHFNEQSSLGLATGGAKTSNFIHVDTIEITIKDIYLNKFKLSVNNNFLITISLFQKYIYFTTGSSF
jgi:hypothetical protein